MTDTEKKLELVVTVLKGMIAMARVEQHAGSRAWGESADFAEKVMMDCDLSPPKSMERIVQ